MPRQPASQKIHSGEECGPCVLCEKSSIHYTLPVEWDDSLTQMIQQATNIQTSSCVCKACGDDFKRNHHKPHYIPRWITPRKVCAVHKCKSAEAPIVCKIADTHYIHSTLNIPTSSEDDTMLCLYDYHVVYRSLPGKVETYSRTRCTTCKKDLSGRTDHHHCPSPQIIRHHLQEKTGHDHEITPDSIICTTCYKAQMSILQGECLSTDLELMQVIESLEAQSQETSQSTIEKAMNNSINAVGTKVAYMLLKQEALLLPDAHDTFCECFEEEVEQNLPAEVSPNNLATPA